MVVARHVQRAVHDEQRQFVVERSCMRRRLRLGHRLFVREARCVEQHYAKLFEEGADLAVSEGSRVKAGQAAVVECVVEQD